MRRRPSAGRGLVGGRPGEGTGGEARGPSARAFTPNALHNRGGFGARRKARGFFGGQGRAGARGAGFGGALLRMSGWEFNAAVQLRQRCASRAGRAAIG